MKAAIRRILDLTDDALVYICTIVGSYFQTRSLYSRVMRPSRLTLAYGA